MKYRIVDGDGKDSLDIITDEITQEGVIVVRKVNMLNTEVLYISIRIMMYIMMLSSKQTQCTLHFKGNMKQDKDDTQNVMKDKNYNG